MDDRLVARLSGLASPVRLKVMRMLLKAGDAGLTASEIAHDTNLEASTLSSHLAQLLTVGLIIREKRGRYMVYAAAPGALAELRGFIETLEKSAGDPRALSLVPILQGSPEFIGFRATLEKHKLPVDDLGGEGQRYFTLVDAGGAAFGHGGIEGAGADQLIRSLIIYPAMRGKGMGRTLMRLLERQAKENGAQRVWLLTPDPEKYFARLRYKAVDRAQAPKAITRTKQFAKLCPASAKLMVKEMKG